MSPFQLLKQVISLIAFLVLGFILVHFMAVFGLFFALALPILHLFFYPQIMCFWCQLKHTPHRLAHSLIDALLTIVVTLTSIALVYGEYRLLQILGYPNPPTTVTFTLPTTSQYLLGSIIPLRLELTGLSLPVNVIQADLKFDPSSLRVKSVTTANSFAKFFLQKDFSNEQGYVRITGGLENPGYTATSPSLFATVYFQSLKPGFTTVDFLPTTLVLANNGQGDNLLATLPSYTYLISDTPIEQSELKLQEDLIIREENESDSLRSQLTFYESPLVLTDPAANILGDQTQHFTPSRLERFLSALARLDQAIVELWQSLLSSN